MTAYLAAFTRLPMLTLVLRLRGFVLNSRPPALHQRSEVGDSLQNGFHFMFLRKPHIKALQMCFHHFSLLPMPSYHAKVLWNFSQEAHKLTSVFVFILPVSISDLRGSN